MSSHAWQKPDREGVIALALFADYERAFDRMVFGPDEFGLSSTLEQLEYFCSGYEGEEEYFEVPVRDISENPDLLDLLVNALPWAEAMKILQWVEQYRLSVMDNDLDAGLRQLKAELHVLNGKLLQFAAQ